MSAVVLDGLVYTSLAVFTALNSQFGSDEAAKFINPTHLFWLKTICNTIAAAALALKMYRSTSYAEHLVKKNGNGKEHNNEVQIQTGNPTSSP